MSKKQNLSLRDSFGRDRMGWFATLVFAITVAFYLIPLRDVGAHLVYLDTWADIPMIGLIAFVILFKRPKYGTTWERGFWTAWGAGFTSWFIGRFAWGLFPEAGLSINLFADFLFLLLYVGILVGLELDPAGSVPTEFEVRLRRYKISGGIVLLLAIFGYFTLIPALLRPATYESWMPAVIGSVILDSYVLIRLLVRFRAAKSSQWRRVYGWLMAAFGLWVVTGTIDVITSLYKITFLEEGAPHYLVWYVPCGLVTVAAMVGRRNQHRPTIPSVSTDTVTMANPLGSTPLLIYPFILPLCHVALGQTGLSDPELRLVREVLLVVVTLAMAGLIYTTHRMILLENQRLRAGYERASRSLEKANFGLENRVNRRTSELEEANQRLAADIQDRSRMEQRLRAAEARNLALIQAVPDALVLVDYEGVVLEVFSGRANVDRLDLRSVLGRPLIELLPTSYRAEIENTMDLIRKNTGSAAAPMSVESLDGTRHFEFRFGQCGNEEILVVIQDVTERRAFESSLQQSQKLESLGIMAGGIAHDFNNLLSSILGNAQMLSEILNDQPAVSKHLGAIESNATRAAKLTGNLLAYAGEAHIEQEPLDLARVFAEMNALLAAAVPKRAHFEFKVSSESLWIVGNEAQVTQILLNLARNAAEALNGGDGSVFIELQRCRIGKSGVEGLVLGNKPAPGEYVRLRVQDTGCGMTPEVQQRIFDPFYTSKGAGRGLGLAAVLGIVSHHGGALTMKSTSDEGTVFTVYFPCCAAPIQVDVSAPVETESRGTGTILVVDDEDDVRELIVAYLNRRGFATVEAGDGAAAVAVAKAHRGQLAAIFMDYSMPTLTGVEAFHLIRREDPTVPVIMMSGYSQREALSTLTGERLTGFVKKPFQLSDLTDILYTQCGLRVHRSEA